MSVDQINFVQDFFSYIQNLWWSSKSWFKKSQDLDWKVGKSSGRSWWTPILSWTLVLMRKSLRWSSSSSIIIIIIMNDRCENQRYLRHIGSEEYTKVIFFMSTNEFSYANYKCFPRLTIFQTVKKHWNDEMTYWR